jgi:SAM-dependent methyltransferase
MSEHSVPNDTALTPDLLRTASYYDRTAAAYDAQVDGLADNRAIRDAFRSRVAMLAGAGRTILDFGCGTGIDAAWYAERGHRVIAYDISPAMLKVLRSRCVDAIARGAVIPIVPGDFKSLESTLKRIAPLGAIAANFAVLNHVEDLAPLLASLSTYLAADGSLVASVLNPWYRGDMRRRWWWRGLLGSLRTGAITVRGDVTTYRHFMRTILRRLPPTLGLVDVGRSDATGWKSLGSTTPGFASTEQFQFLVLRHNS